MAREDNYISIATNYKSEDVSISIHNVPMLEMRKIAVALGRPIIDNETTKYVDVKIGGVEITLFSKED